MINMHQIFFQHGSRMKSKDVTFVEDICGLNLKYYKVKFVETNAPSMQK